MASTPMEIDSPLATVERSIRNVEEQIKAVEDQLKNEQDPDEKKYLREEKKQLRTEKEQLRTEKLLLLKSNVGQSRKVPTEDDLMRECHSFCETRRHDLEQLGRDATAYKCKYASSITPVCTLFGRPCLLWDGVGNGMPVDPRFMDRQGSGQVTVVLAPSGSGKTRMLLEVAARRACLFFTGSRLRLGNVAGAGSDDVNAVVSWLEDLPGGRVNETLVECAVGALLLSRLYILRFLKQLMPTLSALDWAFFQVEYPAVSDVFQQLVRVILASVYVEAAPAFCALFSPMVSHLATETGWEGLCILDESQTLLHRLEGRFRSLDSSGGTRPVLNPLVSAIVGYCGSGGAMFVSGTGQSMTKVRESFVAGSMKPLHLKEIYSMGGFSHVEDMEAYMQKYIDVSCLDMGLIAATYRGRRRWLVTALEEYMVVVHGAGKNTGFFMELVSRMASLPGSKLGVVRSL